MASSSASGPSAGEQNQASGSSGSILFLFQNVNPFLQSSCSSGSDDYMVECQKQLDSLMWIRKAPLFPSKQNSLETAPLINVDQEGDDDALECARDDFVHKKTKRYFPSTARSPPAKICSSLCTKSTQLRLVLAHGKAKARPK